MKNLLQQIDEQQRQLSFYKPYPEALQKNLFESLRVELTYHSNAIEGNTLTLQETALVIEKGLAVAGKTLVEHLEAKNHAQAFDFILTLQQKSLNQMSEETLLKIHTHILKGIDDRNAGFYRNLPVRISGSRAVMPNPLKVPKLMEEFIAWLHQDFSIHPVQYAAEAHLRLVSIHPFIDGNGRTARLLFNLLLMQQGYGVVVIKNENRLEYLQSIEKAQVGQGVEDYYRMMYFSVLQSQKEMLKLFLGE